MPPLRPRPLPRPILYLLPLLLLLAPGLALADPGEVTLPLGTWEGMLDLIEEGDRAPVPPEAVVRLGSRLEGSLERGVFTGSLDTRFHLLEGAGEDVTVRVPVLDAATSIDRVLLDGQPTSLLREGDMYTVGVSGPGEHRVQLRFYQGREDERFSRELRFALPSAGPTALTIQLPEQDIEARLSGGAITATRPWDGGTRIDGQLDSRGLLDLSWSRRPSHQEARELRAEASMNALFTLHEALIKGVATLDYSLLEGETDRLELSLPPEVEVVDVTGDAVLQWYTDLPAEDEGATLAVLLRYLVEAGHHAEGHDEATLRVHFQFPVELEQPVPLHLPLPTGGIPVSGAIGVQGPAGLEVEVSAIAQAEQLTLRDLPSDLLALTPNPLLLGFSFQQPPSVALRLERQGELELTSTLVDDIQSSTVLMEDGAEVTKLRLRVRNNTRQHLAVRLPADSTLTHALLDGHPVRPALLAGTHPGAEDGLDEDTLLLPLRQSERSAEGGQVTHTVADGETLGGIALHYYSDTTRWREILHANSDQLHYAEDLAVGQRLRIELPRGLEESSFVLELAYKRKQPETGLFGRRQLHLPELDVDTMAVTWHLYLPRHLEPLSFGANLTQYDAIHYDPFQRAMGLLRDAFLGGEAWAGGGYQSILSQRKAIYREESNRRQGGEDVVSSFPLVGERYRFARILAGDDVPRIRVTYVADSLLPWVRGAALAAAFGLCSLALGGRRSSGSTWVRRGAALLGFAVLLALAHHVLGVHRRLVWGCDLALAWSLLRSHGPALRQRLWPALASGPLGWLSWRSMVLLLALEVLLLIILAWPLLASCMLLLALAAARGVLR